MMVKPLEQKSGLRTFALVLELDDDVMEEMRAFAETEDLSASYFIAIGAFREAVLAFFDWEKRDYIEIPIEEQVEVVSLTGNIARKDGEPMIHAHAVVARPDGATRGGHLVRARVRPTLEVIVVETPERLDRVFDPESRLALLRP